MKQYKYALSLDQPVNSCNDCPLGALQYDDDHLLSDEIEGGDLICLAKIDPSDISCSTNEKPHGCPLTFMTISEENENA